MQISEEESESSEEISDPKVEELRKIVELDEEGLREVYKLYCPDSNVPISFETIEAVMNHVCALHSRSVYHFFLLLLLFFPKKFMFFFFD